MSQSDAGSSPSEIRVNLLAICLGVSSAFVVQTMLLIAVPLYALKLGAAPLMIGIILSVPYLLPLILAIPLGGLITRQGGRKMVIVGAAGLAACPWIILWSPGLSGLFIAQLVIGIAQIVMILAGQSIISGLGGGKNLERYVGWYTTCLSAGQLVGPLLAGWVIDAHGIDLCFVVMSGIAVLGGFSGLFLTGSARVQQTAEKGVLGYRAQAHLLKTNPGVQISIALTIAVMFALGAHGNYLPVYLESLSISATVIGALLSLRALCAMAVRPFMSLIIGFVGGRSAAMVASSGIVAAGLMFTGLTDNIFILGLFSILVGIGSGISQPLSMVVLAEHVSKAQRSSALGMRLMGNRGVQFLAPLILGVLVEFADFSVTFFVAGMFVLVFMGVICYLIPAFKKQETETLALNQTALGARDDL